MPRAAAGAPSLGAYLAAIPAGQRAALQRLRRAIRAAAPGAEECFYYGMPAFRYEGKALVAFAAAAHHCALYPLSGRIITAHRELLARFETSKGAIRFQPDRPLPVALIRRLVRARIDEIRLRQAGKRA